NVLWTPPRQPAAAPAAAPPELPADLAGRIAQLKLTDVIDIALRNNTATSAAWADARSAAASYGAAKGQIYPTVALNGTVTAIRRTRSEEHTSELQSLRHLVCRPLLEKKRIRRRQS